jgi:hypothetical protein
VFIRRKLPYGSCFCITSDSTLAPIFDAAKEQQRIDENRAIAQIGSQVADIVRTSANELTRIVD